MDIDYCKNYYCSAANKVNDYTSFICSRLVDVCYLTSHKRQSFLHQTAQSLNFSNKTKNKFDQGVTAHFGSYEMAAFDRLFSGLGKSRWVHSIARKCAKDVKFLYKLDQLAAQYPDIEMDAIISVTYMYKGDFKAAASLLNGVKDSRKINNLTGKGVELLCKDLLKSCRSTRWNKEKFHSFLRFLSTSNPWQFLKFTPAVQYKIQTLFLKLEPQCSCSPLAQLIINKDFIKLDSSVQLAILHKLYSNAVQWDTMTDILSDAWFQKLSEEEQKGVFNLIKFIPWKSIKVKFTESELKQLSQAFSNDTIEIKENRVEFEAMLKTKNFDGLQALIKKDRIESFQKSVLSHSLALLTELKQHHLKKTPVSMKKSKDPYTLTESQMKLYLGDKFKERSEFTDHSSWLKSNLDVFVNDVYSKWKISAAVALFAISVVFDVFFASSEIRILSIMLMIISAITIASGYGSFTLFSFSFNKYEALKKELFKILEKEDQFAFYHGASGDRGAFYEMYTQLRTVLTMTAGASDNEITVLRDFDDHFSDELTVDKFKNDVERRWKNIEGGYWYDCPNYYASRCISTNTGLLGNIYDFDNCTMTYWQRGRSLNNVDHKSVLTSLISRLWGKDIKKTDLDARANAYNTLINKMSALSGGTLLQILVDKNVVDDVAFMAETQGMPLNIQLDGQHCTTDKPSQLLGLQKQNPNAYEQTLKKNSSNFKQKHSLLRNHGNHFATQQGRVIPHPKVFTDPEKVKIYKYDAAIPETDTGSKTIQKRKELDALRKQLKEMIREDVMRSIANGVQLEAGSIATHKGMLPIQRYYQYVMAGVLDEHIEFKTDTEKTLEARKKDISKAFKAEKAHATSSDLEIGELLMKNNLEPKSVMNLLKGYPELRALFEKRLSTFGSKQEVQTEKRLKIFESQKDCLKLGNNRVVTNRLMRLVIAFEGLAPKDQLIPLVVRYMAKMGFKEDEVLLATNLLSCDIFDAYIFVSHDKLQQSRAKTEEVLKAHAARCGVSFETYFRMQYLLQVAKAKTTGSAVKYNPQSELQGLELPEAQPDLKDWIKELLQK